MGKTSHKLKLKERENSRKSSVPHSYSGQRVMISGMIENEVVQLTELEKNQKESPTL